MRVAALYDIHGTLPALEAVLAQARVEFAARNVLQPPTERDMLRLFAAADLVAAAKASG